MELVSSKDRVMNAAEIFASLSVGEHPQKLTAMSMDGIAPGFKAIQVNNTVFQTIKHNNKKGGQFIAHMFNADTIKNLPENIIEFIQHLQRNEIGFGTIMYRDDLFTSAFEAAYEQLKSFGVKITIAKHKTGIQFIAFVTLGDETINLTGSTT